MADQNASPSVASLVARLNAEADYQGASDPRDARRARNSTVSNLLREAASRLSSPEGTSEKIMRECGYGSDILAAAREVDAMTIKLSPEGTRGDLLESLRAWTRLMQKPESQRFKNPPTDEFMRGYIEAMSDAEDAIGEAIDTSSSPSSAPAATPDEIINKILEHAGSQLFDRAALREWLSSRVSAATPAPCSGQSIGDGNALGADGVIHPGDPAHCEACRSAAERPAPTDFKALYHELLFAVERKFPGESRHETALKYIRAAENETCREQKAAAPRPGREETSK